MRARVSAATAAVVALFIISVPEARAEDFVAPDAGKSKTDYACTFHWFRTADGHAIGMDVIRSDDTQKLGLRVFFAESDGSLRSLILTSSSSDWNGGGLASSRSGVADGPVPGLGRGKNWIAGSVVATGQSISSVSFDLDVKPEVKKQGPGFLGLDFLSLNATDYTKAHTKGWVKIDDVKYEIDAHGPVSIHFGDRLPDYAYVTTVPDPAKKDASQVLVAAVHGDDARVGGELLFGNAFIYGFGTSKVAKTLFTLGKIESGKIPLGSGRSLELTDLKIVPHHLLDVRTLTATAHATYVKPSFWFWQDDKRIDLGQVIIDFRGTYFTDGLPPVARSDAEKAWTTREGGTPAPDPAPAPEGSGGGSSDDPLKMLEDE